MALRRAVFLDRDGTLNEERGYLREVAQLALLPRVAQAIRALNDAGILCILTTNQTGAARGFYDEAHIQALHRRLEALLQEQADARLDAIFYCPHLEKGCVPAYAVACDCRKPGIGMIRQAMIQFPDIALSDSFVIGDKASDVDMAANAGCQSILVKTGYGQRVLEGKYQALTHTPTQICDDLAEAVFSIIKL